MVSIASIDSRNTGVKIALNQSSAKEAQFFWNNQRRRLCIRRNGRASDVANFRIVSSEDLVEIERDGIEKRFVLLQMHFQDDSMDILKIENEKICF